MQNNILEPQGYPMPPLKKSGRKASWFGSDAKFDQLYPLSIQMLADRHWTPLAVARKAASFLAVEKGASILDIGSGVGKFCLAAAHYRPDAFYYGIEQRKRLVGYAEASRKRLGLENISFINGNFTQTDFRDYDHFYFFNPFYENILGTPKIDRSIDYSFELFNYYNRYLHEQLKQKPSGTRLASFHSLDEEMPRGYHIVGSEMDDLLKFWIKL
jgi:SAM-dependent methyltransferase